MPLSSLLNLFTLSWAFLKDPHVISAALCAALAIALSYLLSSNPKPRDAKLRLVAGDVQRVSPAAYVFRSSNPSLPNLLLDTNTAQIIALHEKPNSTTPLTPAPPPPTTAHPRPPRLSISLPLRTPQWNRNQYREETLANAHQIRVLDRGLHFHHGRAVSIALPPPAQESLLQFNSRFAAEAFLDVLYHVRAQREPRPDNLSLFLTTFNVGNSQPPHDLSSWLGNANHADVVAIGAQECSYTPTAPSSVPSVVQHSTSSNRTESDASSLLATPISPSDLSTETSPLLESADTQDDTLKSLPSALPLVAQSTAATTSAKEHWHSLLAAHFPEPDYTCIAKLAHWDRCLSIFVRTALLPAVSRVRSDTAKVGLVGMGGNKGAIGVRFSVFDTNFVIINSHLAAHMKEVNRRNEDFSSIAAGLKNLRDHPEVDVLSSAVHHLFWMGDLNYRIAMDRDKVLQLVEDKQWAKLREADQLVQEMVAGRAFQGFQEGKTDFPPTYRYEFGSREYSAFKLRVPSYCDRVLYRSLPGSRLELGGYNSADDIMTSDHSPVYATFTASLVHTTGTRSLETIASEAGLQEARDLGIISPMLSPIASPRSLSMRALIPSGLGGSGGTGLQLHFKSLRATGIPEMDHGGHRIAVAKAFRIHNHVGWKKHDELGEGQHADPYCTFHGDAVAELDEGEYRTRTVTASQNPVWEGDMIPVIDLINSGTDSLRRRYVVITVKDEIATRRDDVIGSTVLWLGGEEEENENGEKEVKFNLEISSGGRQHGVVSGSYVVKRR
eukprot:GFKZ01008886.1.p1 GENE.GFKZ01008886.1~~GFKZ01008886.1.p1  ORF type:complete len:781 (+),score=116.00 GFKZ01008886.1:70-2412(+)